MNKLKNSEELKKLSQKYQWYHSIEISDGIFTNSTIPHFKEKWDFNLKAMDNINFENKRVLDIGCRDGLFSFEAEKRGAKEVIAIDNDISVGAVEFLIPLFDSKVKMYEMNLYDLYPDRFGMFDIVIFYGVLYHLRYPFWALKKITDCLSDNGQLLIESGMLVEEKLRDKDVLYCPVEDSPYESTSCTFFNERGLTTTMRSLDFELINWQTINRKSKTLRSRVKDLFRIIGINLGNNKYYDVTRQILLYKKNKNLKINIPPEKIKHDNLKDYWDGIHNKSKEPGSWPSST